MIQNTPSRRRAVTALTSDTPASKRNHTPPTAYDIWLTFSPSSWMESQRWRKLYRQGVAPLSK